MSLVGLLENEEPSHWTRRADKVMAAYEEMDAENREAFRLLIGNPDWSGGQIASAMNDMGFTDIDDNKINHFRRKLRAGKVIL